MSLSDVRDILKRIEDQLATVVDLDPQAQQAIQELLNLVEHLVADQEALHQEVQRLKQQLDNKKRTKTTNAAHDDKPDTDHSSEKHRRERQKPKPRPAGDRRSFKDLTIHEIIECPVDPDVLPPDAVRVQDESVIVQDIAIKPCNIRFERHVYFFSAAE